MLKQIYAPTHQTHRSRVEYAAPEATYQEQHAQEHHHHIDDDTETMLEQIEALLAAIGETALSA